MDECQAARDIAAMDQNAAQSETAQLIQEAKDRNGLSDADLVRILDLLHTRLASIENGQRAEDEQWVKPPGKP